MNLGILTAVLRAVDEVSPTLRQVGDSAKKVGDDLQQIGLRATAALTVPIAGGAAFAVTQFTGFNHAMTESLAIMGNVSEETKARMERVARDVALTTTASADQAAEAYYFLASAGLDAAASIEAMPVVARFAQAGAFDLAQATDLLTDAQSALGLAIRDDAVANMENMAHVGDVLVKANTLANASVQQFSEALTNKAGSAIRLVNKDMEEGVAVLATFADQGVKGSEAGERLNIVLRDLQTASIKNRAEFKQFGVSVYDSSGTMRNMADIVGDLEGALAGMSDEQRRTTLMTLGFQDRSVAAIMTLIGFSANIRNYETELRKAGGTTEEVANRQMESLKNQMILLWHQVRDVAIELGVPLAGALKSAMESGKPLLDVVVLMVKGFADLPGPVQLVTFALFGLTAAAGPALIIAGQLVSSYGILAGSTGLPAVAAAAKAAGTAMTSLKLTSTVGSVTGLTTAIGTAGSGLVGALGALKVAALAAAPTLGAIAVVAASGYAVYRAGSEALGLMADHQARAAGEAAETARQMKWLTDATKIAGRVIVDYDEAVKIVSDESKRLQAAQAAAAKATAEAAAAAQNQKRELPSLTAEVARARAAVAGLTGEQREQLGAGVALGLQNDALVEKMSALYPEVHLTEAAVEMYRAALKKSTADAKEAAEAQEKFKASVKDVSLRGLVPLKAAVHDAGVELQNVAHGFAGDGSLMVQTLEDTATANAAAEAETRKWALTHGAMLAPALADSKELIQEATAKTSTWRENLRTLATSFSQMAQTSDGALGAVANAIGRVITSVNTAIDSVKSMRQGFAQGFSLDGITNMASGVLGMVGAVASLVQGWFGVSKEVKEARQQVDAFQEALWKTLSPAQLQEAAGRNWAKTLIGVRDQFDLLGLSAQQADVIVGQLLNTDRPEQAKAALEAIQGVLDENTRRQQLLNDAISEYGFTIDELGPKFRAQQLAEQGNHVAEQWQVLIDSGIEIGTVNERMADKINEYLAVALRTGTEVPASMRPMLDSMLEMGLLTDESGNKLESLEGLTFSETLTQGVNRIVDAIERLTGIISRDLPDGAGRAADQIERDFRDRVIPVLEDTSDAVNKVIEMHSPTGLEGIAHYSGLAADAVVRMSRTATASLAVMQGGVDRTALSLDRVGNSNIGRAFSKVTSDLRGLAMNDLSKVLSTNGADLTGGLLGKIGGLQRDVTLSGMKGLDKDIMSLGFKMQDEIGNLGPDPAKYRQLWQQSTDTLHQQLGYQLEDLQFAREQQLAALGPLPEAYGAQYNKATEKAQRAYDKQLRSLDRSMERELANLDDIVGYYGGSYEAARADVLREYELMRQDAHDRLQDEIDSIGPLPSEYADIYAKTVEQVNAYYDRMTDRAQAQVDAAIEGLGPVPDAYEEAYGEAVDLVKAKYAALVSAAADAAKQTVDAWAIVEEMMRRISGGTTTSPTTPTPTPTADTSVAVEDALAQVNALLQQAGRGPATADEIAYLSNLIGYKGEARISKSAFDRILAEAHNYVGFDVGTLGRYGSYFHNFGPEQTVKVHNEEAIVRRDQASDFARQYGGGDSATTQEVRALRRELRRLPEMIGVAVSDAVVLAPRRVR